MSVIKPIAHIYTDMPQKFGIPRQSGLAANLQGRVVFNPEYANPDAVRGIEGFSHLWLLWVFENGESGGAANDVENDSANPAGNAQLGNDQEVLTNEKWAHTVRPPMLGGTQRIGVFATRSPFRPNPIGLSVVRLDHVEITKDGPVLHVLGADLRNGTPILDVKPYVPYADCQPDAIGGFTEDIPRVKIPYVIPDELLALIPESKRLSLTEVLEQDPRPVGNHEPGRVYDLAFAGFKITFVDNDGTLEVTAITPA